MQNMFVRQLTGLLARDSAVNALTRQHLIRARLYHGRALIGKREVVGFGTNGSYSYIDRADYPLPAIRFREDDAQLQVLRQKEKGDWNALTIEEKKTRTFTSSVLSGSCFTRFTCQPTNHCLLSFPHVDSVPGQLLSYFRRNVSSNWRMEVRFGRHSVLLVHRFDSGHLSEEIR
jgi:hypothetical protein